MSRSYKKNGWCKEHHVHNISKRYANKRVRNYDSEELLQNSDYKKVYESYDICDWSYCWTRQDAINDYYESERLQNRYTLKEWLECWEKIVYRK